MDDIHKQEENQVKAECLLSLTQQKRQKKCKVLAKKGLKENKYS